MRKQQAPAERKGAVRKNVTDVSVGFNTVITNLIVGSQRST